MKSGIESLLIHVSIERTKLKGAMPSKPSELDQALVRDKSWTVLDNPRWPGSDHCGILLACGGKELRPVFMSLLKDKGCLVYVLSELATVHQL